MRSFTYLSFLVALLLCATSATSFAQGVTTASVSGQIADTEGETLIGATVIAVHKPSGTTYGTVTDENGRYRIANMRVGGPYEIEVTYTGYGTQKKEGIVLRLGEAQRHNFDLESAATQLQTITVTGQVGTTGQNAGASTQISTEDIEAMPTLNRNLEDFVRLTPQVSLNANDGISVAGVNNRYNAIYIDGAVNNDVFGLADNGANGGQTGIAPFSIDIIDQFQVVVSPYDVTLGGFAGGGINAVTKSGTNQFAGTAYFFTQNESMVGKTNGTLAERLGIADDDRTKSDPFTENLYGASIGGPIVKDKVFFFVNAEIRDDETPNPFEFADYEGDSDQADLEALKRTLLGTYGYDPGTFGDVTDELNGLSFFGKVDINLNENHRLTLRHQYTKGEQFGRNSGNSRTINFSNNGLFFPTTTNSSALELNSTFGTKASNNLIIGYTTVRDDRDPIGGDFPYLTIDDGIGEIRLGSEQFSTANQLDQDILTITDNFKLYRGDHTITIGTHNEFYSIYNLFIQQNYGAYEYNSLDDFLNGAPAALFERSYSLVDDLTGDGSAAAADFNAMQLGFYVQDEWNATEKLTLTGGLRVDIPILTSDPATDAGNYLNEVALPAMAQQYDIANEVEGGTAPDGQLMFSPRLGFNYDISGDRKTVIRGGAGIFTSRIPFVWPGAMFNNNGITQGAVELEDVAFIGDINNQYTDPDFEVPSGDVNLFVKDFKYPQVARANLGLDHEFDSGLRATLEGIYTKTLNNVLYTNINNDQNGVQQLEGADDRNYYTDMSIDDTYRAVYVGSNTDEGYTYTLTGSLAKRFDFNNASLNLSLAYTYGDAQALNEGTSSQNSSQWRGQVHVNGRNNPVVGRSDFAIGHRVVSSATFSYYWTKDKVNATTISLFLDGQSGQAFSYVIGGRDARDFNNETGSTSRNRTLAYVPASRDEINLIDWTDDDGNVILTADEQWANLDAFIEDDAHLSERRGDYAEKNGRFAPWETILDLAVRQDLGIKTGGNTHKLQLSLDVFNFLNLINKDWGVRYFVPGSNNNYELVNFEGFEDGTLRPTYTFREESVGREAFDIANFSSRWQMRLGVRYIFN
jgi:hypothetical protein